jgi:hypothetical protein
LAVPTLGNSVVLRLDHTSGQDNKKDKFFLVEHPSMKKHMFSFLLTSR